MSNQRKPTQTLHQEIKKFLTENADDAIVKKYARYFKEGYDAYGIDKEKLQKKKMIGFNSAKINSPLKKLSPSAKNF